MEEKIYKVDARGGEPYLSFDSFICTEKALKQYIKKIKADLKENDKTDLVRFKKNSIVFPSYDDIELFWEEYKQEVVTSFGEMYEVSWNVGGYDDTYLHIEAPFEHD